MLFFSVEWQASHFMLTRDLGIFDMSYILLVQININLICPFRLRVNRVYTTDVTYLQVKCLLGIY